MTRTKTVEILQEIHNVGVMLSANSDYLAALRNAINLIYDSYTPDEIATGMLLFLKNDIHIADAFLSADTKNAKSWSYWLAEARRVNEQNGDVIRLDE